jgi:KUP system potassium uptake protein
VARGRARRPRGCAVIAVTALARARRRFRARPAAEHDVTGGHLAGLSLAALGVVYGDIGTSPLYALKECFRPEYGLVADVRTVHGLLSLIAWALIIVISVKYVVFILRLDNDGEGGILALLALVMRTLRAPADRRLRSALIALGLFGAALLLGEGAITPAISVLSAMEGLRVAAPPLGPFVLPFSAVILFALFIIQKWGTASVGRLFGPVMLVWFITIGSLGAIQIARRPSVLLALNPWHGLRFLFDHGYVGLLVLGAVVLVITGAEALYADLGHFGRRPIRLAWFVVVMPGLMLSYFGQGALVLGSPEAVHNPFYMLAPRVLLYPLIALATAAAVVASQALVSGAFSLVRQAVQLRYSPRVSVVHTSASESGQIYVPEVNTALMLTCLALVFAFRSSTALAAAYGVAVTGTMVITTTLFVVIARYRWHWPTPLAGIVAGLFMTVDLGFFAANVMKISDGGWVPLALATCVFTLMSTWKRGSDLVMQRLSGQAVPLETFIDEVAQAQPSRVPGTAVVLTPDINGTPPVLVHHFRHNKVLHEQVVLLSVVYENVPDVADDDQVRIERLRQGFVRVHAHYGFMEPPAVQQVVEVCCAAGLMRGIDDVTFYLGRARILPTGPARMFRWRKRLYGFMALNATSATDFFGIPPHRVFEIGARVEL